jgi:hypothetical protein
MVAWAGGNKVYALDLDKKTWPAIPNTGDPGPAICNGTYGRWAYSPKSQAFVAYNWYENNAFLLKLPTHGFSAAQATQTVSKHKQFEDSQKLNPINHSSTAEQAASNSNVVKQVLTPVIDTYLGIYQENTGKLPYLELSTNHRSLVKFTGSELDKSSQVKRATLRMYQKNSKSMPPIYTGIFLSNNDWQEDSNWKYSNAATKTKWLQSPGDWQDKFGITQGGQPFDLQQVIVKPEGQWLEWEVTELVKRWQSENNTTNLGMVVRSLSGQEQAIQFYSREYEDVTLRPQLIIETESVSP